MADIFNQSWNSWRIFYAKYSNQSDDFYERPAIGRFFFFPKGALSEIFNYPRRILKSTDMKGFQRYFLG